MNLLSGVLQFSVQRSHFIVHIDVADDFVEGGGVVAGDLLGLRDCQDAYSEDAPAASDTYLVTLAHRARGARRRAVDRDRARLAQLLRDRASQDEAARTQKEVETHRW